MKEPNKVKPLTKLFILFDNELYLCFLQKPIVLIKFKGCMEAFFKTKISRVWFPELSQWHSCNPAN